MILESENNLHEATNNLEKLKKNINKNKIETLIRENTRLEEENK